MIDIYCHTAPSGRSYVGLASCGWRSRWRSHVFEANRGSRLPLHAAIRKYGPGEFQHCVLETVANRVAAEDAERFWIAYLLTQSPGGYNATAGGDGTHGLNADSRARISAAHLGKVVHVSDETREKTSASQRGRAKTPLHRARISAAKSGKARSAETRDRLRVANTGKRHTPETRAKMRAAHLGVKRSPDIGAKIRAAKIKYPMLRVAAAWVPAGRGWSRDRSNARFDL